VSTLLLDYPAQGVVATRREDLDAPPDRGDGPTLDELVTGVWEGLVARRVARCPACGGAMRPRHLAGHGCAGGACDDCGAQLS